MNFQGEILAKFLAILHFTVRFFSHLANFNEIFGQKNEQISQYLAQK